MTIENTQMPGFNVLPYVYIFPAYTLHKDKLTSLQFKSPKHSKLKCLRKRDYRSLLNLDVIIPCFGRELRWVEKITLTFEERECLAVVCYFHKPVPSNFRIQIVPQIFFPGQQWLHTICSHSRSWFLSLAILVVDSSPFLMFSISQLSWQSPCLTLLS